MTNEMSSLIRIKHKLKKKFFTLVLFLILLGLPSQLVLLLHHEGKDHLDKAKLLVSVSHSPIFIDGNDALDAFCSGAGTDGLSWASAHVIEGYEIVAELQPEPSGNCIGIEIRNTDRFLVIKNCDIQESVGIGSAGGIFLQECQNINITGCEFSNNDVGINMWRAEHMTISSNNILQCGMGVRLEKFNNGIVSDNIISDCTINGILLKRSDYNTISSNEASFNRLYGIKLEESKNNIIRGNNASYNSLSGISLDSDTENNQIYNNVVCYNEGEGILDSGSNNDVHDNEECIATVPSYLFSWMLGFVSLGFMLACRKTLKICKRKFKLS
ncbi:MAG: NosD domain-containing protein [Candidatus Hodarchaeota archaeon]